MEAIINIYPKEGILDPQGKAVESALEHLNFNNVSKVCVAKQIKMNINEDNKEIVKQQIQKMCEEILVNTVIEDYEIIL